MEVVVGGKSNGADGVTCRAIPRLVHPELVGGMMSWMTPIEESLWCA
ncbi:uncharacterized protein G2W53_023284 [Senna tora]|uniref:Uncharacterized protein n=1 Tax=Senna tora TaxID=362788 RepID=A0A834TI42_9FABA|nr:uncharacterized protein G2W53_023284 [Senna tora]